MSERPPWSLPPAYFDHLYQQHADPWDFASSDYEARKYRTTLAALPGARYDTALEIGCSIGVFTRMLALRCHRLLALDVASYALAQARERCIDLPHVEFVQCQIPLEFP
jgi:ubiquinone/menaquinone biosynthesis C-methylase UbiE